MGRGSLGCVPALFFLPPFFFSFAGSQAPPALLALKTALTAGHGTAQQRAQVYSLSPHVTGSTGRYNWSPQQVYSLSPPVTGPLGRYVLSPLT